MVTLRLHTAVKCTSVFSPLLLDFLDVFNTDGTASPGAKRTRLFPSWAFPRDYQRLPGREERKSVSQSKYLKYLKYL